MGKDLSKTTHCIFFCNGGSCTKKGAAVITRETRAYLKSEGLHDAVHTVQTKCNGRCEDAPTIIVQPENTWYKNMTVEKSLLMVDQHIKEGRILDDKVLYQPGMEYVDSDNPLPLAAPKRYEEKFDNQLGKVIIAQANPWDQELYPMLKDIFQKFSDAILFALPQTEDLQSVNGDVVVNYEEGWVTFDNQYFNFKLAIGLLTKDSSLEMRESKIGYAEVFKTLYEPFKTGVRFRTKRGDTKLVVFCKDPNHLLWHHLNKIYLLVDISLEASFLQA